MLPQGEEQDAHQDGNAKLHEGATPFAQSIRDIGIGAPLSQAADAQERKAEQNEGDVADVKGEGRQVQFEAEKGLQRIGEDSDGEEKDEVKVSTKVPRR